VTYAAGGTGQDRLGSGSINGSSGAANTGNGGGGGGSAPGYNPIGIGGTGGSGIVIIRYKTDGSDGVSTSSTGGTITTSGSYTIHTFTTGGTFGCVLSGGGGGTVHSGFLPSSFFIMLN